MVSPVMGFLQVVDQPQAVTGLLGQRNGLTKMRSGISDLACAPGAVHGDVEEVRLVAQIPRGPGPGQRLPADLLSQRRLARLDQRIRIDRAAPSGDLVRDGGRIDLLRL